MLYFTSDLHLGHDRILEVSDRPFSTVAEMNETLIDNIAATVGPADTLYIVGDVAMGDRHETLPLLDRIICKRKVLITGNHDHVWRGEDPARQDRFRELYDRHVEVREGPYLINVSRGPVTELVLNHFGRAGTDTRAETRRRDFSEWEMPSNRYWALHGHTHGTETINREARQVHVGVDAWDFRPVSLNEIFELIA